MKKVLLTLTLAAFAFAANAQFVIGGQIGFTTNGGSVSYVGDGSADYPDWTYPAPTSDVKATEFTIAPKFGYQLNDKMQVGLSLGIHHYSGTNYDPSDTYNYYRLYATYKDFEGWEKNTYNDFFLAPYFRYNIGTLGKFTIFCEVEARLGISPRSTWHEYNTPIKDEAGFEYLPAYDTTYKSDYKSMDFRLSVVPGLNYKFNDRLSADLYIDLLGVSYYYSKGTSYNWNFSDDKDKMVYVESNFGLNADLTAHTLTSHLSNFRLGFNYHF